MVDKFKFHYIDMILPMCITQCINPSHYFFIHKIYYFTVFQDFITFIPQFNVY